jgi:hypothetical protein
MIFEQDELAIRCHEQPGCASSLRWRVRVGRSGSGGAFDGLLAVRLAQLPRVRAAHARSPDATRWLPNSLSRRCRRRCLLRLEDECQPYNCGKIRGQAVCGGGIT